MSSKHIITAGIAVLIALSIIGLAAGTIAAVSWVGAAKLPDSQDVRATDRVDIAAASDIAVIWANTPSGGVTIARRLSDSSTWTTIRPDTTIVGQTTWAPTIDNAGDDIVAGWAEGATRTRCGAPHTIVSYNVATRAKDTIPGTIYSRSPSPDIAGGSNGWHMVFLGSPTAAGCDASQTGLYYSHQASLSQPWSAPQLIVTHEQVLDGDFIAGSIAHVRIATIDSPPGVQVAWEQTRVRSGSSGPVSDSSVWTIAGTTGSSGTTWGTPTRLSPTTQVRARRPAVTANATGDVHFTWIVETQAGVQNVDYRSLDNPASLQTLNPEPVYVTANFPSFAGSAMAVRGNTVCTAWYGYTAAFGTDLEEIPLRCSDNGGATWQTIINVSESSGWLSIFPAVAMDASGILHFAWTEHEVKDNVYVPVGVYYRNSEAPRAGVFLPLAMRGR